jgi:nicotinamidase-related amidase
METLLVDETLRMTFQRQSLGLTSDGYRRWQTETTETCWPATATALLLCDVWNRHTCPAAETRLERLVPRMAQLVDVLRARGVQIVHAPSDTMAYYAGSPARERLLAAPKVAPPADNPHDDPPLPIDATGGGCDADREEPHPPWPWTREHPGISIDETADVVSDNGRDLYSFYQQRGIRHVLIMGVHTNMCVLNRTFAIKQLVRWGAEVALIRDLTDAMYDPARPPYVSHDEGVRLVVEYIEKFWCPTVASADLFGVVPAPLRLDSAV